MSNSDIQKINSNEVMSAVTVFNKVVYLSGQVPKNTEQDVAGQTIDAALIARTVDCIADVRASAEGKEGVQSFLQKRKPGWLL